jgi:gamma-glutamylcyclotransferase (GGCT)/AIG2-like uncharacterized protein YtfP
MNDRKHPEQEPQLFRLFVYGTLKRGYWNHEGFCRSLVSIEEATVHGRLYELPSGIPALEVHHEDVMCVGTSDPVADAMIGQRLASPSIPCESPDWQNICGQLLAFGNPARDIPPIDRLESFYPGKLSLYVRVLVPVMTTANEALAAWCYVASALALESAKPTDCCEWIHKEE